MNSICKVCGMVDTKRESYDGAEFCNDCYSVEQGFIMVEEFEGFDNLVVDEDGLIYVDGEEYDGPIACEVNYENL